MNNLAVRRVRPDTRLQVYGIHYYNYVGHNNIYWTMVQLLPTALKAAMLNDAGIVFYSYVELKEAATPLGILEPF